MKKILLISLLLIPSFCFSQEYSEVVQAEGKTADQLYSSAREWFAKIFNSANDVLQMDDPVAGKLIGKGIILIPAYNLPIKMDFKADYTIAVSVKDGRYKYDIDNIMFKPVVPGGPETKNMPFSLFAEDSVYYKNGSDPKWLIENGNSSGDKINKSRAKTVAQMNAAYYNAIKQVDKKIESLVTSLKSNMISNNDDW